MDIRDIIKSQCQNMDELNELLDYEREVLINNLADKLPIIVDRKKEIAAKIISLEKQRQNIYKDKSAEDLALEGLIDMDDIVKLRSLINDIKEKDETNLVLTKQSLGYIKMMSSILNPARGNVVYNNNGNVGDVSSSTFFTTKV